MIDDSAKIHSNVRLGEGCQVEAYVIIGIEPKDQLLPDAYTLIGPGAIIRAQTVIYAGNRIGRNFRTGNKANIRESNVIGDDVSVGTLSVIEHHVVIGDGVRIHSQAFIPEYTVIEDRAWIGPNVVLTNAKYPNRPSTKEQLTGCTIRRGAIIGANVTVLPGIDIGACAMVGAGAVVTKDVPTGAVVVGNPARELAY